MASLINLMDEMEGEAHHVPNQTFATDKVDVDEFPDLVRELRETLGMSRNDETRCIVRALLVLLQMVNESRHHIREIHARLDEMVSNTKGFLFFFFCLVVCLFFTPLSCFSHTHPPPDLRLRTSEVLATVEKENCLNIPQVHPPSYFALHLSPSSSPPPLLPFCFSNPFPTSLPSKTKSDAWWKNMEPFSPSLNRSTRLLLVCVLIILL